MILRKDTFTQVIHTLEMLPALGQICDIVY